MNDLSTTVRTAFIAQHRERVARLTIGTLNETARRIRADLDTLTQYQQPAYREDVTGVLGELCVSLGKHGEYPAVYFEPRGDSGLAEELMVLGAELQKHLPRKMSAILASQRMDVKRLVIWWELPSEPRDDVPYEAAA